MKAGPRTITITAAAALLTFGPGCSPHAIQDRSIPTVMMPDRLDASPIGVEIPEHWWTAFEDSDLDQLVNKAFATNLNLAQAWDRLDQVRAQADIQGAFLYPEVNLDASGARSRQSVNEQAVYGNRFALGLGLSWELDLWRKIANRADAAKLLADATRDDAEQTALLLSETVVGLWFTIQEQEQLLDVLNEQIRSSRQQVELIELRYGQGVGDALQVLQQRLQLAQVEAEIPTVESTLETTRNQLAIVLGQAPQFPVKTMPAPLLPELPAFPELPTPRELLELRPDLRAAHARLAAADHEVAASIADMLPTVRISLDGGFSSAGISSLFDNTVGSIAGSILQPVFDADRRGAEVDRRKAILRERTKSFGERFLIALREIEDAIDRERFQLDLLDKVVVQLDLAGRNLEEATIRFAQGQTEYLDVIVAIQTLQRLQRQEVAVRRFLLTNRAALYVAVGGEWTRQLTPPEPEDNSTRQATTASSGTPQT